MPRRSILSRLEREHLLALPDTDDELIRHYTLSEPDLSIIRQHRGDANRLGFAVQLCYMRYPGVIIGVNETPVAPLLRFVASQLNMPPEAWTDYGHREQTRREHITEIQLWLGLAPFSLADYRRFVHELTELGKATDRGIALAQALVQMLREQRIVVPAIDVIERLCGEALTRGTRLMHEALTAPLTDNHRCALDCLLDILEGAKSSVFSWLRQSPGPANAKHILIHLRRLKQVSELKLPDGLEQTVHQNRLRKLAREGGQMTGQHLRNLEPTRRYATLLAVMLDTRATLIDEIIDMHDRFIGSLFAKAKRIHAEQFQKSGKAINDKVRLYSQIGRALLDAKQSGGDPFAAIETIIPWDLFSKSIIEAEELARPEDFDYLELVGAGFSQLRRYTPTLLKMIELKAAPAAKELLTAVETLKDMNDHQIRKVPADAPISFIRKRWKNLVFTLNGFDRPYYEMCVLAELKNSLRSGDIWVRGSRQFKDFEEYLMAQPLFLVQRDRQELGLAVEIDCEKYLRSRLAELERELATLERLAAANELPDARITNAGGLKISPLDSIVPDEAEILTEQAYSLLPHVKITELLLEVDNWINFTQYFTHLKSGATVDDRHLLLTAILADAINLGLYKMAEACPEVSYAKLAWLQAWHIRDETYSAALAELVNAQSRNPFAAYWGDGITSSSDGQHFKAGGKGHFAGQVNLKYGKEPSVQFYTHISDQYAPFHTKVINSTVRDATHVLDGLLCHESDLRIEEHYTDTAGFTDHVFGLMHLLGFRFAPRIRDLADKRLYIYGDAKQYPTLTTLIGDNINVKQIRPHWDHVLRMAASIKQGSVTASLMLRKLGSYPRQNGLALALRELGRIERTIFIIDWIRNAELRRRVQIGLNKGEAKNSLARAVFLNRLGEIRDRSFESQRYRASGLNLVVAAIILWNTVYLERAIAQLRDYSYEVNEALLPHLSPLGWEHINLTGDYVWQQNKSVEQGQFRPLRNHPRG